MKIALPSMSSIVCLLMGVLLTVPGCTAAAEQDAGRAQLDQIFPRSTLTIATPDARLHRFDVWVAADDARRSRGLMFVQRLEEHEGMIFIYPEPRPISMWMKNTFIPLDMVFVSAEGRVAQVVENTKPHSLETVQSSAPALAVIELKGGTARKLNIRAGALVEHAAFSGAKSR